MTKEFMKFGLEQTKSEVWQHHFNVGIELDRFLP